MDPAPQQQPSPPEVEVLFCDLCNASVPEHDLQVGKALRHHGRVIGACCLGALRSGGTAQHSPVAARTEARTWPLALIMLAAVAAGTLHLDQRIEAERTERQQDLERLTADVRERSEVLVAMDGTVDGVAESIRTGIPQLQQQLVGVQEALQALAAGGMRASQAHDEALATLRAELDGLARKQVDPVPALQQLDAAVQSLAMQLAEQRAQPVPPPAMPQPGDVPPARQEPSQAPPAGGLPPELAHQVARLADADPAVRFDAVDELVRSKHPLAAPALLPLAKDGDLFVRRLAVEGLRHFRTAPVLDALVTALADPEELVRETAWRSLQEMTGQKLPFDAAASREVRSRAQRAWAEWAEANKATFGTN